MYKRHSRYTNNVPSTRAMTTLQKSMEALLTFSRILLGAVFVFSGFVKAIDPLGSTYKIHDYLMAFGGGFAQLTSLAFPAAIALSTLELLIGLCFLFKIKLKLTSIIALVFMGVMLPLTFYIALKNPVTDCGCFGDALKIGNWATFYKNVVLLILVLLVLVYHRKMRNLFLPGVEWTVILLFIGISVGLSVYTYRHLPMIDFLPYKVGVNIPEAMKVPEGKPLDKYDTKLIYEKDGVQKEFTIENYPQNDSTWKFIDQKTTLVSKGYEPPIHHFEITDAQGNHLTDEIIHYPGIVNLVVMHNLTQSAKAGLDKAEVLYEQSKKRGEQFYALTGSSDEDIAKFVSENKVSFPFYKADPTTLKTIIRANPGFVQIKNGTITGKWNWRQY